MIEGSGVLVVDVFRKIELSLANVHHCWNLEINNGVGMLTATDTPFTFQITPSDSASYQVLTVSDATICQAFGMGDYIINALPAPHISLVSDTSACANHIVLLTAKTTDESTRTIVDLEAVKNSFPLLIKLHTY